MKRGENFDGKVRGVMRDEFLIDLNDWRKVNMKVFWMFVRKM